MGVTGAKATQKACRTHCKAVCCRSRSVIESRDCPRYRGSQLFEFPLQVVALVGHDALERPYALLQGIDAGLELGILAWLHVLEAQVVAHDACAKNDDDDAQNEELTVFHRGFLCRPDRIGDRGRIGPT